MGAAEAGIQVMAVCCPLRGPCMGRHGDRQGMRNEGTNFANYRTLKYVNTRRFHGNI